MGVRSSNTTLKDEDDDYAHQIVIGDLERLSMDASVNTAAIATNATDIATNTASIATNTTDIAVVAADLASLDLSAYAQKASNLSDLTNVVTARSNLGLGALATLSTVDTAQVANNAITNALIRDSAALSVIGRAGNTTGDPADIAGVIHQVLRIGSGPTLAFGALALNQAAAVTGALPPANGGTGVSTLLATGLFRMPTGAVTTTTYTTGSGTHTFTRAYYAILLVGGGGAGADGSASGGSGSSGGGGGGAGAMVWGFGLTPASTTYTVGVAGVNGGADEGGATLWGEPSSYAIRARGGLGALASAGAVGGSLTSGSGASHILRANAPFIFWGIAGQPGQPGIISSFTYNGAGAVGGVTTLAGRGGSFSAGGTRYGQGGNGAVAGASGSDGTPGVVMILEWD